MTNQSTKSWWLIRSKGKRCSTRTTTSHPSRRRRRHYETKSNKTTIYEANRSQLEQLLTIESNENSAGDKSFSVCVAMIPTSELLQSRLRCGALPFWWKSNLGWHGDCCSMLTIQTNNKPILRKHHQWPVETANELHLGDRAGADSGPDQDDITRLSHNFLPTAVNNSRNWYNFVIKMTFCYKLLLQIYNWIVIFLTW